MKLIAHRGFSKYELENTKEAFLAAANRPYFGIETLSWLCILGAAPFAAIGFIKYNGMNAEEFLLAYIRSEFLTPKELVFNPTNYYYEILKGRIGDEKKDENNKKSIQTG